MRASLPSLLNAHGPVVDLVRARFPNALGIYAFGSQVRGTAGAESDLDLALLVAGYADPLALWDIASALEAHGRPVAGIGTIMNWAPPSNTRTLAKSASHHGAGTARL